MSDLGNKKVMSYNIKRLLNERHITRQQLATATGINYNTLSSWMQGRAYPRIDKIEIMANYFGVPKSTLVERPKKPTNELPINKIAKIPLVGSIAMGTPITAEQNIDGYIPEYFVGDIPEGQLFALKCKGHSMEPTIPDGAIAIIREQCSVEDDEIAAVLIDNEATLKRVRHVGKQILLVPDNKDYKPIILDSDKSIRILGKLIKYTVDF